jgi:23S rRNA (cytidine1920-2'-O)/16S rRNA (cytidine1409-2'-O)-methyltransferase
LTPQSGKPRLDEAVVANGLAETRARAQAIIMGGAISVDGEVVTKPAARISPGARLELVSAPMPYASRGGLKLKEAIDRFGVDAAGKVALDVGASTGGFTDVLLQEGAKRVYAVDVGYGQLAWELRKDSRVAVMERTNIRHVEALPEVVDLAVIDVSFISLRQVLPPVRRLLSEDGDIVALVKPQFEAGRGKVGKKGVVRDPAVWTHVLHTVLRSAAEDGWTVRGVIPSPIRGPAGNVEFLVHLSRLGEAVDVDAAVGRAVAEVG